MLAILSYLQYIDRCLLCMVELRTEETGTTRWWHTFSSSPQTKVTVYGAAQGDRSPYVVCGKAPSIQDISQIVQEQRKLHGMRKFQLLVCVFDQTGHVYVIQ